MKKLIKKNTHYGSVQIRELFTLLTVGAEAYTEIVAPAPVPIIWLRETPDEHEQNPVLSMEERQREKEMNNRSRFAEQKRKELNLKLYTV